MTTKRDFKAKKQYDRALPRDFFNQNFIDLETSTRYGFVDPQNNLIMPKASRIISLDSSGQERALSFVVKAYSDMYSFLRAQIKSGQWESNSSFKDIQIRASYTDPFDQFDLLMRKNFEDMQAKRVLYRNKNISNFVSLLSAYDKYMSSIKYNKTCTLAGFAEKQKDIHQTGLTVEFLEGSKNESSLKYDVIFDPAFKRYLLLAEKYGFYINRNAPWSLVANLNSPAMQKYASEDAGINITTGGIIDRYYDRVSDISYDFFVGYMVGIYNSIANAEPTYSYLSYITNPCKQYIKKEVVREVIPDDALAAIEKENRLRLRYLYFKTRYHETFGGSSKIKEAYRRFKVLMNDKKTESPEMFSLAIEKLLGSAKNSNKKAYQPFENKATPFTFETEEEAEKFARDKIGCLGAHQMPNGKWMPCKDHQQYKSLTGT